MGYWSTFASLVVSDQIGKTAAVAVPMGIVWPSVASTNLLFRSGGVSVDLEFMYASARSCGIGHCRQDATWQGLINRLSMCTCLAQLVVIPQRDIEM